MKIIFVCSANYLAIPAALKLKNAGLLQCVVIPEQYKESLLPNFIQAGVEPDIIFTVTKESLEEKTVELVRDYDADAIFVITFPWKLPQKILDAPRYGCINFHPGLLPKYKGADPIFWQLKNREPYSGFTVHRMTEIMDEGPVLLEQKLPVIPGETYGIHQSRLGALAAEIVLNVTDIILSGATGVAEKTTEQGLFLKKPDKLQVTIDWQRHGAEDIEALVNASNPRYNGAFTSFRNMQLTILEVGFANITDAPPDIKPGTIIYADALYGPIVACADGKFIKINTVCIPEGYVSGSKLVSLGCVTGEQFN